ncbi:MAG: YncE family protein [Oscillospiraceae bacterium]|jgi:YVTN family beta-propeller protein|nr:YncE family protein [Oscillospiraceae bacterium]
MAYVYDQCAGGVIPVDPATGTAEDLIEATQDGIFMGGNRNTGYLYYGNTNQKSVTVIDAVSKQVIATIPVGTIPRKIGINERKNLVYVPNQVSKSVSVIDGTDNAVIATIPLAISSPYIVVANPNNDKVYAGTSGGAIAVIDGLTNTVTGTITGISDSSTMALNPNTNTLYVHQKYNANTGYLAVIDSNTDQIIDSIYVGADVEDIAIDPNSNLIYVPHKGGRVDVISGNTNQIIRTFNIPSIGEYDSIRAVAVGSNGDVYFANYSPLRQLYITDKYGTLLHTVDLNCPGSIVVMPQ